MLSKAVDECKSDAYYKTLTTHKQLLLLLYGVITKCSSFNSLCKSFQFLENKLSTIGISELPARSTFSDANINRNPLVFETLYSLLYAHYSSIMGNENYCFIKDSSGSKKIEIIDSSTITLFSELFKGAGRNTINGAKKGGLKIHTKLPLGGYAPDMVYITEAACNDKDFLGQLDIQPNTIYLYDKGYVNYKRWAEIDGKKAHFVTRLNRNAVYETIKEKIYDVIEYADGGVISDKIIELKSSKSTLRLRLITYKDPESRKVLKFITNLFDYNYMTVAQLYKYRWSIEVFFKKIKQNFQLSYFYSDSSNGIRSQIWIALIANLLMSVIQVMTKQKEDFSTVVSMAAHNMASFISLVAIIIQERPSKKPNMKIIQLNLFRKKGGVFTAKENTS